MWGSGGRCSVTSGVTVRECILTRHSIGLRLNKFKTNARSLLLKFVGFFSLQGVTPDPSPTKDRMMPSGYTQQARERES